MAFIYQVTSTLPSCTVAQPSGWACMALSGPSDLPAVVRSPWLSSTQGVKIPKGLSLLEDGLLFGTEGRPTETKRAFSAGAP